MAASPKVSIDKTEAQFLVDEATYLEAVVSQEIITPGSQNVETGLLQTVQGRLALAFVNVFEFGVNQAGDDTTAMQAAFTAGGASVYYIPPGAYTITSDITADAGAVVLAAGVTLTGGKITSAGEITLIGFNTPIHVNINDLVTLVGDGSTDDEAAISAAIVALPDGSTLEFSGQDAHRAIGEILISGKSDLILDGRGTLLNITAGIRLTGTCNRVTIRNFRFDGSFSATSKAIFANDGTHTDIRIENCLGTTCGQGVALASGGRYVNPQIVHNTFVGCVAAAGSIEVEDTTPFCNAMVANNHIRDCVAGPGIRLTGLFGFTITSNQINNHDAGDAAIYLDAATQGAVSGNFVTDTEFAAFEIAGAASRISATGNTFVQSGTSTGDAVIIVPSIGSFNVKNNLVNALPDHSSGAATPISSLVPSFVGQDYLETTTPQWFKSTGLTSADWVGL